MKCIWCQKEYIELFTIENIVTIKPKRCVCNKCKKLFNRIDIQNVCEGCGRESSQKYCQDCQLWLKKEGELLVTNQALFHYDAPAKEWVKRYKFQGDCRLVNVVIDPLKRCLKTYKKWGIVPISTSQQSMEKRGFDAVKYLVSKTGLTYLDLLVDVRTGKKQSEKNREERIKLEQPFEISGTIPIKNILLVDDIYTTGTTLHRAAELFKQQKGINVKSVTLFR